MYAHRFIVSWCFLLGELWIVLVGVICGWSTDSPIKAWKFFYQYLWLFWFWICASRFLSISYCPIYVCVIFLFDNWTSGPVCAHINQYGGHEYNDCTNPPVTPRCGMSGLLGIRTCDLWKTSTYCFSHSPLGQNCIIYSWRVVEYHVAFLRVTSNRLYCSKFCGCDVNNYLCWETMSDPYFGCAVVTYWLEYHIGNVTWLTSTWKCTL